MTTQKGTIEEMSIKLPDVILLVQDIAERIRWNRVNTHEKWVLVGGYIAVVR